MRTLSISAAWDETKAILARDGRLFASVALALILLPAAILGVVSPGGLEQVVFVAAESNSLWILLLLILAFLVMLAGQLAVTRLAIGPSESVGGAIAHAVRRLPAYVTVAVIAGAVVFLVLLLFSMVIGVTASPRVSEQELATSPAVVVAVIVLIAVYLFLLTRIIALAAAVASTEALGPIRIIRRSWSLTSGHSWRLFTFLIIYIIGTGIALFAISSAAAVLLQLFVGKIDPFSASALVMALIDGVASSAVTVVLAVMLARIYVQLSGAPVAQPSVPSSGI